MEDCIKYLVQIGLIFDVVGVYLLAKNIIFKSDAEMRKESSKALGGGGGTYNSDKRAKFETKIGLVLIMLGFLLQIFGNI
jgi:hypothetical protein